MVVNVCFAIYLTTVTLCKLSDDGVTKFKAVLLDLSINPEFCITTMCQQRIIFRFQADRIRRNSYSHKQIASASVTLHKAPKE
jgi:hypothetical protein